MKINRPGVNAIIGLAALASFALSLLANYQDPWVNTDGSLYLRLAEQFSQGAAMGDLEYHQPFYAWLIHLVSGLTTLSFKHAAWLINAGCCGLLAACFVGLCTHLRPSRGMAMIAAAVILLYPPLNEYRAYVVRDFGFWTLAMIGLYLFCVAHSRGSVTGYLIAALVLLAGSLFRFESVLLAGLPLLFALRAGGFGWRLWIAALLAAAVSAAALYQVDAIGAVVDVYAGNIVQSMDDYGNLLAWYSEQITGGYLEDYALLGVLVSLAAVFAAALIGKFHIVYLVALIWLAFGMRGLVDDRRWRPVIAFFGWSLAFILAYFLFYRVLQGRHFIVIFLPVLVLLAVALHDRLVSGEPPSLAKRAGLGVLALLLFVDGFISFGAGHAHVAEAVRWSEANLEREDTVLVNEPELAYEVTGTKHWDHIDDIGDHPDRVGDYMANYDAVILAVSRKSEEWKRVVAELDTGHWVVDSFENKKGDQIVVLKRQAAH